MSGYSEGVRIGFLKARTRRAIVGVIWRRICLGGEGRCSLVGLFAGKGRDACALFWVRHPLPGTCSAESLRGAGAVHGHQIQLHPVDQPPPKLINQPPVLPSPSTSFALFPSVFLYLKRAIENPGFHPNPIQSSPVQSGAGLVSAFKLQLSPVTEYCGAFSSFIICVLPLLPTRLRLQPSWVAKPGPRGVPAATTRSGLPSPWAR